MTDNRIWSMDLKIIQIYKNKIIMNNYMPMNLSDKAQYCIIFKYLFKKGKHKHNLKGQLEIVLVN